MSDVPTPPDNPYSPPTPPINPIPPSAPSTPPEGLSTQLAIVTLILGIVGLVMCPLLGIAAIITGIITISRTNREPRRYGGQGMAIAGLVCGCLSIVVAPMCIAILLPSLSRARELSKRLVCQSNMQMVASSTRIARHDGECMKETNLIQCLIDKGHLTPKQTICISTELTTTNYVVVPGAFNTDVTLDPRAVILYEPLENHNGEGGNVTFADGHTEFIKSPNYEALIKSIGPNLTSPE